jgi:hypothetical protein
MAEEIFRKSFLYCRHVYFNVFKHF